MSMKPLIDQVLKINLLNWTKHPYFNAKLLTDITFITLILSKHFDVIFYIISAALYMKE